MPEVASYVSYYGLKAEPFGERVEPRLLYRSVGHEQAMESLVRGIEEGKRLQAVVALPGTGKTMVLHALAEHFRHAVRAVLVFQTNIGVRDYLEFLSKQANLQSGGPNSGDFGEGLAWALEAEKKRGRLLLIAIDEAQHLSAQALAELQNWSRSAVNADALRIVLAAQPEFRSLLCSKGLESLREELSVCDLPPLMLDEVPAYINQRLRACGFSEKALFTPEAFALLAKHSRGNPCVI